MKVSFRELGKVAGPSQGRPLVAVPKSAVRQEAGKDVVFIVANGRVERRAATVAGTEGEEVLLSTGVSAGEKIAVGFPGNMKDGMRARMK